MSARKKIMVSRGKISLLMNGLRGIAVHGNTKYELWLKIEKTIQDIEPKAEENNQLLKAIEDKCGFSDYKKRIREAAEKDENYTRTPLDYEVENRTKERIDEFSKDQIELSTVTFTEEEIKSIGKDGLQYRSDIFPLIDIKKEAKEKK